MTRDLQQILKIKDKSQYLPLHNEECTARMYSKSFFVDIKVEQEYSIDGKNLIKMGSGVVCLSVVLKNMSQSAVYSTFGSNAQSK